MTDAAKTLGVTVDDFELFLDSLGVSYDDYIQKLNENNQKLDDIRTNIEKNYDCTFKNYIDTLVTVNNKTLPTSDKFKVYKSEYSVCDAYIPINKLDTKSDTIKSCDVVIYVADNANDIGAFDMMRLCGGDFRLYFDKMTEKYKCNSVEISTFSIFGGYGVTRPPEKNPCMDKFFVYSDETGEILDEFILSMLTFRYEDVSKNITLALSDELGLLFKTTGADSKEKMLQLKDFSFQIRKANHT